MRPIDADKINLCDAIGGESDFAKDIRKAVQELITMQLTLDVEPVRKWISVEDREPTFEGKYLVAILNGGKYHTTIRKWKANAGWCRTGAWERSTGGVRFWQPLPEPPKMDGGSE